MLHIQNLCACYEEHTIFQDLSLSIRPGELHVIMGPNGAGKSTLGKILVGDPSVQVVSGEVLLDGESLLQLEPEQRAHRGLFIGFQQPPEIPGVSNETFLYEAWKSCQQARGGEDPITKERFQEYISEIQERYHFGEFYHLWKSRNLNDGFSGGERKKHEIWQMVALTPRLAWLDEPDSGLDVDALRMVCRIIRQYREDHPQCACCIVTHNPRMGEMLSPDYVHIIDQGRVQCSKGIDLMLQLEQDGYRDVLDAMRV